MTIATETKIIEKPMLFSGPMVRAILEGRKTQTRRVVKPQPEEGTDCPYHEGVGSERKARKRPHPVGSRIWVREEWACCGKSSDSQSDMDVINNPGHFTVWLKSNCFKNGRELFNTDFLGRWRDASIMPRWASRITLEVTDVRIQRLQEISETDAKNEGVDTDPVVYGDCCYTDAFIRLWNSINCPDSWAANPWVWAYTFKRVEEARP